MTVYITTRSRLDNLIKIVPRWVEERIPVILVVEPSESRAHSKLIHEQGWDDVSIATLRRSNQGIGYARKFAVEHANANGLRTMIMSDDDMRPARYQDTRALLRAVDVPRVLGIGATRSLHDRFTNGAVSANHGPILCPGGWGAQLYALNIDMALRVGNFDERLDVFGEDHELIRQGIGKEGIPWLVHCDVKCEAIGVRYAPGGINALVGDGDRALREIKCREIIHRNWPEYTSAPKAKPRMRWQKMLDDYIPSWRNLSAIHGGEW